MVRGRWATWVVIGCVLACVTLRPREAHACHTGEKIGRVLFGLLALGIDIPLTIHDLTADRSSNVYAVGEIVVAGGLTAGSIALSVPRTCEEGGSDYPTSSTNERVFTIGLAAWNVALVAHGIWTLAKPPPARTQATIVITPMADISAEGASAGLGLVGRF